MSKWNTIYTNRVSNGSTKEKTFNRMIATTKSLTIKELKKEGDDAYADRIAAEDKLVKALKEKKLTDKVKIAEAKKIIAKREKEEKSKTVVAS